MARITFKNVTKRFGSVIVLQDLELTIEEGEFFTFVGPSGCGKSTVLNLIAGLEDATSGNILFDGKAVDGRSPRERDVAMVFQSYALYPHMTVYENIAFPLRMQKTAAGKIQSEVRQVADLLGLGELLARRPRELSGGQRQRVALGRAIVRRPRVFLLDEPLSNLDARLRVDMRAEMKRLHQELGITTVYVTHDQSEAMGLSERLAVLDRGRVRQVGAPRDVYGSPADLFVAGFIGSPPMNILSARVIRDRPLEIECLGRRFSPETGKAIEMRSVLAGIRPENVSALAVPQVGVVEAAVMVTEPAGAVTWVEARWKDTVVRAAAPPDMQFRPGDPVFLSFDAGSITLFDAQSGVRL